MAAVILHPRCELPASEPERPVMTEPDELVALDWTTAFEFRAVS